MILNKQIITRITDGNMEPFSLFTGGKRAVLRMECSRHYRRQKHNLYEFSYAEENLPLRVVLKVMDIDNYPVLKFALSLYAEKGISENIHNIKILDFDLDHYTESPNAVLRGITGGFIDDKDNFPFPSNCLDMWDSQIKKGLKFKLDSGYTGKSSGLQMPLWLYSEEGRGIWFGPEWTGTWDLELLRIGMTTKISVGIPTLDFKMYQGECLRLPWVTVGGYEGSVKDGFNHLRRTLYDLFLPTIGDEKPVPPVVFQGLGGHEKYHDENGLFEEIKRVNKIGAEAFVTNGGWYQSHKHKSLSKETPFRIVEATGEKREQTWFETLGDYTPHPERFPSGFDTFVNKVHEIGMKIGLWMDPRINKNATVYKNYKDVLIQADAELIYGKYSPYNDILRLIVDVHLLDLSKDEGREFFYDTLKRFVTEYNIDWIWFDINTDMRTLYWDYYEQEDRKGILELTYYHGFYEVLDRIMREHPDVWIESCGTGGKMMDLAILQRCHSVWVDDFVGWEGIGQPFDIDINRNFRSGLNNFLPAVYIQNSLYIPYEIQQSEEEFGIYNFLSHFAGTVAFGQRVLHWKERDVEIASQCMDKYKEIRHYLANDFYALFPQPRSKDVWDGWQYHDQESESGVIMVFQLPECPDYSKLITLHGLHNDMKAYNFEVSLGDAGVKVEKGQLLVTVGKDRCALIQYQS